MNDRSRPERGGLVEIATTAFRVSDSDDPFQSFVDLVARELNATNLTAWSDALRRRRGE